MPQPPPKLGLLLVGHGTRSADGTRQFLDLAGQLAEAVSPAAVEPACLELQQPDIATGVRRLVERGVSAIVVCPLLLFAAGHAKDDVPGAIAAALARYGMADRIEVVQAGHLGCHPSLVELSRQRFLELLANAAPVAADSTALLMVGRGSSDTAATAEMHRFANLRHDSSLAAETRVAFVAKASPPLADMLADLAGGPYQRVVVQPHLLFAGEIADSIRRQVAEIAGQNVGQQWLVSPLLADPAEEQERIKNRGSPAQESRPVGNKLLCRILAERYRAAIRVVATSSAD